MANLTSKETIEIYKALLTDVCNERYNLKNLSRKNNDIRNNRIKEGE